MTGILPEMSVPGAFSGYHLLEPNFVLVDRAKRTIHPISSLADAEGHRFKVREEDSGFQVQGG